MRNNKNYFDERKKVQRLKKHKGFVKSIKDIRIPVNLRTFSDLISLTRTSIIAEKKPAYWKRVQQKNIADFVRYIYEIPFYRERFRQAGIGPDDIVTAEDFLKLPPLTRDEYRNWIEEEEKKSSFEEKRYIRASTSGSSAEPLVFYKYPEDNASDIANLYRTVLTQPDKRYPLFRGKTMAMMVSDSQTGSIVQRLGFFRTRQCLAMRPAKELYNAFSEFKPDFLYGMKPAVVELALYILKNDSKIKKPEYVASIGADLSDEERKVIEKAFGKSRVFDMYGSTEVGNFAHEQVDRPHYYVIWHDTHVVNVVDDDGSSVRAGIGQILVTPLFHRAFPLVNYQLNDYVEIAESKGIPYIKRIAGRNNDQIRNADGSYYTWLVIDRVTKNLPGVLYCQVRQTSFEELDFYLVENKGKCTGREETERVLRERCQMYFTNGEKQIRFHWTDYIPVDKNGKRKLVISEIVS